MLVAVSVPGLATAQTSSSASSGVIEEVAVTASRVERSGFTAPTPTTTLGVEDRELRAVTNIASLVNELPSVRPASAALTSQNTGIQAINLRGLNGGNNASTRTLVLVDGKRFVPTTLTGVVNSNVVPTALIERVEVVTGGASAAWGSDAVAGVANFIFKDSLDGFEGSAQYGMSERGDNDETSVSLAWGTGFADGRGQLMVAGEYHKLEDRQLWADREWSNRRTGFVTGQVNGVNVTRVQRDGLTMSGVTTGGVIVAPNGGPLAVGHPLRGIQFGPGSTVQPFNYGTNVGNVVMVGGDGDWWESVHLMSAPLERKNLYARATFDFSDRVRGTVEASVMESNSSAPTQPLYHPNADAPITITRDNAYLQTMPGLAPLRDLMDANGITSFTMGRRHTDLGRDIFAVDNRSTRFVLGLEGEFGNNWRWNTYATHGETDYDSMVPNHLTAANSRASFDAVLENGQIICRINSTDPTNIAITTSPTYAGLGASPGCVPGNVFGPNMLDSAVKAYTVREQTFFAVYKQDAAAASLQGEPFATWAGDVSVAGGVEWRRESVRGDSDPISKMTNSVYLTGGFQFGNPKPISGSYNVKEAFLETVVPLAANQSWAENLDLNGAVRRTDYSTSGQVTTWKAGLTYRPIESLMIRGTKSRDIRAANLNELYASSTIIAFGATDYGLVVNGQPSVYNGIMSTTGNPNLQPEDADTKTVGVTWTPSFLDGFRASVDYFDIEITGAITARGAQLIVDSCYGRGGAAQNVADCALIDRDPVNGRITRVNTFPVNARSQETRGVDYELSYDTPLAGGSLSLRLLATRLMRFIDLGVERAGEIGTGTSSPRWRGNLSAMYRHGAWTLFNQVRYIGSGTYNNTYGPTAIDNNYISARTYLDTTIQYEFETPTLRRLQVFGRVTNLFDKDPPVTSAALINSPPVNQSLYDIGGRSYVVGARVAF